MDFFGGGLFETIGTFEFISNKLTNLLKTKRKKMKIKTASKIGIKFDAEIYLKFFLLGFQHIFFRE